MPRIVATLMLERIGIDWPQSLPAIAFANAPEAKMDVNSRYSFRLLGNYTAPRDWTGAFLSAQGRIAVIAGAARRIDGRRRPIERALPPLGVALTILPGVDHMGVVYRPEAIKAILAAMSEPRA